MAASLYSDQAMVYDLACLYCMLGELDKGKMLLDNAIGMGGDGVRKRGAPGPPFETAEGQLAKTMTPLETST